MSFDSQRSLVLFNCNDGQLPQVELLIESLRSREGGNYAGRVMAISTGLSSNARRWLEMKKVELFERKLDFLQDWEMAQCVADTVFIEDRIWNASRESSSLWNGGCAFELEQLGSTGLALKVRQAIESASKAELPPNLESFGNKRFSKLNVIPLLEQVRDEVDHVLFCDTDLLFQSPLECLFQGIPSGRIAGELESDLIVSGNGIGLKDGYFRELYPEESAALSFPKQELNIGVLAGRLEDMLAVWVEAKALMLDEHYRDLYRYLWHEQDFFRLLRMRQPEMFHRFDPGLVFHGCGASYQFLDHVDHYRFVCKSEGVVPAVVHFAGGVWKHFDSIRRAYSASELSMFHRDGLIDSSDPVAYSEAFAVDGTSSLCKWLLNAAGRNTAPRMAHFGAYFGSLAMRLMAESEESLDWRVDLVDSCLVGHDWEWQLVPGSKVFFAFVPEFGRSQQDILRRRFGGMVGVRLYLGSDSLAYRPAPGSLDFAVLDRIKHATLFQEDVTLAWGSLCSGGWLVVNRLPRCQASIRRLAFNALSTAGVEVGDVEIHQRGDFIALRKM